MIGRVLPIPARDSKARTSVVTRAGDKVRIHPASVNSKLKVEKPEQNDIGDEGDQEPPPEFAAMLFFDEITRGDSMLYIKSCTAMHPHPVILVAAQVVPAPDVDNHEEREEDAGTATAVGVAQEVHGMQSMQLGEVPPLNASNNVLPDTGLLVVDGWLTFRVPIQTIAQLSCLRLRVANAFAAKVNRPREGLPGKLQKAMDVSAAMFINESESGDGVETDLGCSFRNYNNTGGGGGYRGGGGGGGRNYGGGRGGGGGYSNRGGGASSGNHSHHLFRYSHHAPPVPHRGGGSGGGGRGRGRGGFEQQDQERSYDYRGGPYAAFGGSEYDDRHGGGVKRNHSGNPREHTSYSHGGGRGGGRGAGRGGGRQAGGGGRSYGRYDDNEHHHQGGRGRGSGRGRRGSGVGRGGGGY
jgi:hypothetical protein